MTNGKRRQQLSAYARQLCISGLDSRLVMPRVVEALRELIGAESGLFFWANERGQPYELYSQQDEMFRLVSQYLDQRGRTVHEDQAVGVKFEVAMKRGFGYGNSESLGPALRKSELYNVFWRPLHQYHDIEHTVCRDGRGWGALHLSRPEHSRPFSKSEQALLASFNPFLSLCLAHHAAADRFIRAELAHLVIDERGRIQMHSPNAIRLLMLAGRGRGSSEMKSGSVVPANLLQLATRLPRNRSDATRGPSLQNVWGQFRFSVSPLLGSAIRDGGSALLLLEISREEPVEVRIMRSACLLGLTARQAELCVHLFRGSPYRAIASRMSIGQSTVVDHVRKTYIKLDVQSHDALIERLLSHAP